MFASSVPAATYLIDDRSYATYVQSSVQRLILFPIADENASDICRRVEDQFGKILFDDRLRDGLVVAHIAYTREFRSSMYIAGPTGNSHQSSHSRRSDTPSDSPSSSYLNDKVHPLTPIQLPSLNIPIVNFGVIYRLERCIFRCARVDKGSQEINSAIKLRLRG